MNPLQWVAVAFILWITAIVCCAGCYAPPPLTADQALAVQAAEVGMSASGHEATGRLKGFHVHWAKDEGEFRQLCQGNPTTSAAACASQKTTLGGKSYPRAVLRPGQDLLDADGCSVVSHEGIHWLIAYLKLAPNTPWKMGSHGDRRFFSRGFVGSAENRACEWLRLNRPR